jgi:hypothetical protein
MTAEPTTIEGTATPVPEHGRELIVRDAGSSIFVALDRHDEEMVVAEIKGELLQTMAYEFSVGGKPARGLSYAGVNSAVRLMNARGIGRISCPKEPKPEFEAVTDEEGDPAWQCMVYAEDQLVGGGAWGLATQKKFMRKRDGSEVADPFSKTKALSKAQRNAKLALIPEGLKAEIIAALTSAQIQRVAAPTEQAPRELPAHDESDEAKAIDADNDQLLDELRSLGLKEAKLRELRAAVEASRTLPQKKAVRSRLEKSAEAGRAAAAKGGAS